jgi:aspartate/methionine/tyrosine aminotransferase
MIAPFIVMDVVASANRLAADGRRIVHLEVGQPDAAAPRPAIEASHTKLDNDRLGYTDSVGIPALREAIAAFYRQRYAIMIDPKCVVVTTGSSAGFLLAFLSAFSPGDRIGVPNPGYPAYRNMLSALSLQPVLIPAGAEQAYRVTPEALDAAGPLKGLLIASPNNPTGAMLSPAELGVLAQWSEARSVRLISDEIYHGLAFEKECMTARRFSKRPIVVNSFSKYFCMTGWRIGWLIVPDELLRSVECLAQNFHISPPAISQHAALAALDAARDAERQVAIYRANRDTLLRGLPRALFSSFAPADGAFYLYGEIAEGLPDSLELCERLLLDLGIACTPGVDFDPVHGRRFIRFSYAGAASEIQEAVRRLRDWTP